MSYSASMTVALSVQGLGKRYVRGECVVPAHRSLKATIDRTIGRTLGLHRPPDRHLWALRNIAFDVHRGEVLGITGRNGSGKTTLLRIISGLTNPTEGTVTVHGTVGTLFGVGIGMHPELTGRENVFVSGGIMGLSRSETSARFDDIVAFAELKDFMDTPVKFYSSGMRTRLSFAVSFHLDHPDILLIDEVFAAGDLAFKRKCFDRLGTLVRSGTTVLLVTHSIGHVKKLADRCLYLKEGYMEKCGETDNVLKHYVRDARVPVY